MKSLYCLLFATLLTVTSYGADKVTRSIKGLEGYGENGILVIIDDRKPTHKGQDTKAIKAKVELQLKKAGFKITDTSNGDHIWMQVVPIKINDVVVLRRANLIAHRQMEFVNNGKRYRTNGAAYVSEVYERSASQEKVIESIVGLFINQWRKYNPKE